MFTPGLVSISFRALPPEAVMRLAADNGLKAVEWGGDVHAPDSRTAAALKSACADCGLLTRSFGSYCKLTVTPAETFSASLAAAQALGARYMRIWAGVKASADMTEADYAAMAAEAKAWATEAEKAGVTLCLECHPDTLTDRYENTVRFLSDVGSPALKTYWQPNQHLDEAYNLAAAKALAPHCPVIHVFNWKGPERYPLGAGLAVWRKYLDIFAAAGSDCDALLEFMPDDRPESLPAEAAALLSLVKAYR